MLLLDRSRHHVALTNAGRIFLREAKDILGRLDHAGRLAKQAADGHAGDLSVGTFPAADVRILPALRPLMAARLPHLRIVLHSKYAMDPIKGLQSGALDVAFVRGPMSTDGLDAIELLREPIVVVLPAHHALARRKRIPVQALHDLPCITMDRSLAPALHDAIALLYRQAHIRMHAVSRADNVLGHLQLVQEGLGFALLPDSVGSLLPPGVVLKPLAWDPTPMVSDRRRLEERQRVSTGAQLRRSGPPEHRHPARHPAAAIAASPPVIAPGQRRRFLERGSRWRRVISTQVAKSQKSDLGDLRASRETPSRFSVRRRFSASCQIVIAA